MLSTGIISHVEYVRNNFPLPFWYDVASLRVTFQMKNLESVQ
jgi:hypothetical protein